MMRDAQKGFTLVEVMIVTAISTVILFGVFGILKVSNEQLGTIHAKMSLEENSREALFKMAQEIRQTSNNKITDNFGAEDANHIESTNTLIFIVPIPSPNAASLVDVNFDPKWANSIQYSLDEDTHQIIRTSTDLITLAAKRAILANDVTALAFSRKATTPELITITANAQQTLANGKKIPATPIQMTMQAQARNP
jgi:prepilin-type N-terminal cleavage/methylation domain-containing protein